MVQAAGIAASSVSFGTALVAICTAMTMIQEKKFTVMLGSICCASSCATLAGICVAVQWLYPWSPSQALVCNIVAGKISSILYCSTVGSVLQFLYSRAMLVDEQARSTTLMKVIQVGIVGVLPFAAFTAAVSRGHVDETFGVCVSHYPVYVAVLFVLATATFSVLLIYKFTASLREHQARLATTDRKSGGVCRDRQRVDVDRHMAAIVPASVLEKIRSDPKVVFADSNTVVLSSDDLDRIKSSSVILSVEDKLRLKQGADDARLSRQTKARERKQRMLELEAARKAQTATTSSIDLEDMEAREALLRKGRAAADEQHDDVKRMNQMVLYAKCVTIRDKQVQQTKQMEAERAEQEKLLDMMMEYERQKAIQRQRETDRKTVQERKKGARTIVEQMAERERIRERERALKAQQGAQLLQQALEREKQAEQDKIRKAKDGVALLATIVAANQEQMRQKQRQKQADQEEDRRIAAYIKEKERRDMERDEQQRRIEEAKERERNKIREAQMKANDHQAEIDALRARRAQEETDRKWRNQQAANARAQAKIQAELAAARDLQRMEKERKMIEQAHMEREQFQAMISMFKEQERSDKDKEAAEKKKRAEYARVLHEQIADLEARRMDRAKVIDMGEQTRREDGAERKKLESIRQAKLAELQKAGVPPKYQAELKRFKVLQSHAMS
ncbi:unnamed protein product (mitochondrion) [Plasmodiophora brassicae]|uniref:Cilia- and flagella-associated protein 45 n=2 Tax=Plasmodiophora brassicae TaxID=37360 RepID=A0A3P3YPI4_PLABS|nr:unnamed protein product [Plasmodiophora brassicae]